MSTTNPVDCALAGARSAGFVADTEGVVLYDAC